MNHRSVWRRWVLLLLFPLFTAAAQAQSDEWPSRTIKIVSPFPPGGTTDLLARLFAPPLSRALGQPVIVENRAGGGGSIGTGVVAKSAPDGYTFVLVFDTHAVNPSLLPNLPFDTRADLAPVTLIATGAMVVAAHSSQPYRSFGALMAAARQRAGGISYGTIGTGSLAHLAMTQMGSQGKFAATHVPYKGGGPLVQDAIAGHAPVAIATTALFSPHIRSGVLVPLAVTSASRDPALPDVPTVAEQGLPGFEALAWWGLLAPARTPAPIIQRMNAEVQRLLREPQIRDRLAAQGMKLVASSPEEFSRFLDPQMARWASVVKEYGIRAGD